MSAPSAKRQSNAGSNSGFRCLVGAVVLNQYETIPVEAFVVRFVDGVSTTPASTILKPPVQTFEREVFVCVLQKKAGNLVLRPIRLLLPFRLLLFYQTKIKSKVICLVSKSLLPVHQQGTSRWNGWYFDSLSEFKRFSISNVVTQGDIYEFDAAMDLTPITRENYPNAAAKAHIIYRNEDGKWKLSSVRCLKIYYSS